MSDHAQLDTVCPNNHDLTIDFSRDEFEAALKAGDLILHCNTCEANWPPSKEEIGRIREQFAEGS
jgi:hypothetical protein